MQFSIPICSLAPEYNVSCVFSQVFSSLLARILLYCLMHPCICETIDVVMFKYIPICFLHIKINSRLQLPSLQNIQSFLLLSRFIYVQLFPISFSSGCPKYQLVHTTEVPSDQLYVPWFFKSFKPIQTGVFNARSIREVAIACSNL